MATSGVTTWTRNKDQVVEDALRKLAVLSEGQSPNANQITEATSALNGMVKLFQADGMPLWAMKQYSFNTTANVSSYRFGVGQTQNTPVPLKIVQVFRSQTNQSNIPINIYTRNDYNMLPLSNNSGVPVNAYYDFQNTYGDLKLWPIPDGVYSLTIVYQRPFEDMVASTDDFDFPSYWIEPLVYGLAYRLSANYGIPTQDRLLLKQDAKEAKDTALSFGTEEGSLFLQPDWRGKT